jgi:outer membrane cobalamin receptor
VYTQDSYLKEIYQRRGRYNINTRYRINNNLAVGLNVNAQVNRSSSFFFWDGIDSGLYVAAPGTTAFNQGFKITVDPFLNWYDEHGNRHKILSRYYGNHNKTITTEQSNFNDLFYGEYQYQKHLDKYALVISSGVLASYAMVSAELYGDSTYNTSNEAVYLQLDKKWFDKLNVSGGVRYEFNQIAGLKESRPVFRLGANYQVANYTFIRASWGQGYRFPTIAEKYISTSVTGLSIYPNPDLTSETGWSGEIGVKQGVKISNWQGMIDVSGFISEYDNMMEFTFGYYPFPGFMSLNIGDTRIMGGEISFIGEGKIGTVPTTLIAGYTYIDPKFKDFDSIQNALSSADYNVLKYRFRHTVKFDVESTIKKFRVGVTCNYNSFMEAVDAAFVDPIIPAINLYIIDGLQQYRDEHADGDLVIDIRLAYNINANSEVSLLCNNVLNREYSSRPAMMDAPRNFTLKYSLTL